MSPLRRTMDAGFLNRVANDATVRPFVGGTGELDLTETLASPRNVALIHDHGGFVFIQLEPGRYELHTMLLPDGRGAAALAAVAEAHRYLFTATDCIELVTKVPEPNRRAALMARRAGYRLTFTRPGAWGNGEAVEFFTLGLDDWMAMDGQIAAEGHAFHDMLETAKRAAGSVLPTHPDDEAHDRAAGASALMARAANGAKAVWSYNRWAAFAGYQTIELLSATPLAIDVRDAVIGLRNGNLEVLKCR